jgi:hypothetical protein
MKPCTTFPPVSFRFAPFCIQDEPPDVIPFKSDYLSALFFLFCLWSSEYCRSVAADSFKASLSSQPELWVSYVMQKNQDKLRFELDYKNRALKVLTSRLCMSIALKKIGCWKLMVSSTIVEVLNWLSSVCARPNFHTASAVRDTVMWDVTSWILKQI